MNESWLFDGNFNGVLDDFFDDAMDDFDHILEDIEANDAGEDWETKFQNLEPPPFSVLAGLPSGPRFENGNGALKMRESSSMTSDDASQVKQWLGSAEASSSGCVHIHCDSSEEKYPKKFQTSSPVSVLESSSGSCSDGNPSQNYPIFVPVKRQRSKSLRSQRQILSVFSFLCKSRKSNLGLSRSELESHLGEETSNPAKKRQKKRKNQVVVSSNAENEKSSSEQPAGEIRKCAHCQVTKTPQWREGPLGPKTLCNACGVRYRSGRLLPEYRPAGSPTFIASLHSNSHRKVLEMRKKALGMTDYEAGPAH